MQVSNDTRSVIDTDTAERGHGIAGIDYQVIGIAHHYSSTINDFFKTNKMADRRNLNTNEIALEETKLL